MEEKKIQDCQTQITQLFVKNLVCNQTGKLPKRVKSQSTKKE
jgi:hypothetical protein